VKFSVEQVLIEQLALALELIRAQAEGYECYVTCACKEKAQAALRKIESIDGPTDENGEVHRLPEWTLS
jgi:hypothetical protein